jgi:hypothetical protein
MSYDIYAILERYDSLTENIDAAQRSVKQLPALFQPKNTSPQLSGPYPGKNATRGYLVGEENETPQVNRGGYNKLRDRKDYLDKRDILFRQLAPGIDADTRAAIKDRLAQLEKAAKMAGLTEDTEDNPMRDAVIGRISRGRLDLVEKYGLDAVMDAVDDVTEGDTDWEEIGSSDVSAYIKRVEDHLRDHYGSRDEIAEGATTEDVLSTMKKKLGDYLQDVATAIRTDPDLKDKVPASVDKISSAVKTITTDDGKEIKIHGNEDDGFRITIHNKASKAKFETLEHAIMACEMYCSRRRAMQESDQDYVEERS